MAAYYNEFDKPTAAWLRELIKAGLIADGIVDERSIKDVQPTDIVGFAQCHFFAGIGGWSHALRLAAWSDDRPVWTGSCPCQPYSAAGKGLGDADERNLWPEFYRLIRECRPHVVFGEQVEGAVRHGWIDGVSTDLEAEGYAVGACVLGAHSVGAPHIRQRLYWVADLHSDGCDQGRGSLAATGGNGAFRNGSAGGMADSLRRGRKVAIQHRGGCDSPDGIRKANGAGSGCMPDRLGNPNNTQPQGRDGGQLPERADEQTSGPRSAWADSQAILCRDGKYRRIPTQPALFPLAYGLPGRVGLLRGYGNAIVPETAAEFIAAWMETQREQAVESPAG